MSERFQVAEIDGIGVSHLFFHRGGAIDRHEEAVVDNDDDLTVLRLQGALLPDLRHFAHGCCDGGIADHRHPGGQQWRICHDLDPDVDITRFVSPRGSNTAEYD